MSNPKHFASDFAERVDWNLLRLFLHIVRAGSIGAAARRLNRQQPSISAALKRLEEHVGEQLLHRSVSGTQLTVAGRALLLLCEDMFEAAQAAPHQISQAVKQVYGLIRIQMVSSIESPDFDEAIASIHRRYPSVQIEIRISPWRQVLDALERGEVELGVGYDSGVRSGIRYEPLFVEAQQLYCGRSHPLFGSVVRQLDTLREEGFVLTGLDEFDAVTSLRQRYGLGSVTSAVAEDMHEARRLVLLGIGIGFLPKLSAAGGVAEERLWPLLPVELEPSYDIYLLARSHAARDTATQLFLDELIRRVRAHRRP